VDEAPGGDYRHRLHRPVGVSVDLKDVAVWLPRNTAAVDDLLAGGPGPKRRHAARAVGAGAALDGEALDHVVVVELLVGLRILAGLLRSTTSLVQPALYDGSSS
jgi:hypothetical protein